MKYNHEIVFVNLYPYTSIFISKIILENKREFPIYKNDNNISGTHWVVYKNLYVPYKGNVINTDIFSRKWGTGKSTEELIPFPTEFKWEVCTKEEIEDVLINYYGFDL